MWIDTSYVPSPPKNQIEVNSVDVIFIGEVSSRSSSGPAHPLHFQRKQRFIPAFTPGMKRSDFSRAIAREERLAHLLKEQLSSRQPLHAPPRPRSITGTVRAMSLRSSLTDWRCR